MKTGIAVVTFQDTEGAGKLLDMLKDLEKQKLIELDDAVIVVKDTDGEVKSKETKDLTKAKGAAKGATLGLVIGLMVGGPIGGVLLGAAGGALLSRKVDLGIPQGKIDLLVAELVNGSSALFVQGTSKREGVMRAAMVQANGTLHELEMTEQAVVDVGTVAATHNYYDGMTG
jgi:uncharacterized membrane protein